MKITKLLWKVSLAVLLLSAMGCEKNDDGSYVPPLTSYEKVRGKWALSSLKQYDEIALATSSKPSEMDLTSKFKFSTFKITFNADSVTEVVPTTYQVEGESPELFAKSGYWDIDIPYKRADNVATKIRLYSDAAKTVLTDELVLVTTPGAKKVLEIKLVRSSQGTPYVSYLYSLKPLK